jgi:hypothetical protein
VLGWAVSRSTPGPSLDMASPPPATAPVDHTGRSPFPASSTGFDPMPSIDNSIAWPYPTVVVATIAAVGSISEQRVPPELAGQTPSDIFYRYVPVTVRVERVLAGTPTVGSELHTRVILDLGPAPIAATAGDRVLLFLSGPGPEDSPVAGVYTIGAAFFIDGDIVIDPYGSDRPLSDISVEPLAAPAAPATPGVGCRLSDACRSPEHPTRVTLGEVPAGLRVHTIRTSVPGYVELRVTGPHPDGSGQASVVVQLQTDGPPPVWPLEDGQPLGGGRQLYARTVPGEPLFRSTVEIYIDLGGGNALRLVGNLPATTLSAMARDLYVA